MNSSSSEFSTPPIWKEVQSYFGPIPLIYGRETGWRMRAKLAVRKGGIGLFKPGTHEVQELIDCPDHHPAINEALKIIRSTPYIPYDEREGTGELRYVQLTVSNRTGLVQLVLVANGKGKCESLAKTLLKSHRWHSIWINVQEGNTNTIFGPSWEHLSGERLLEQTLLGQTFSFHPACFMQANVSLFEQILADMRQRILPDQHLTELYAGVGVIGRSCSDLCRSATLVELSLQAKESFEEGGSPSHLTFLSGRAEEHFDDFKDLLIVDPPRKGLAPNLIEEILSSSLKQVIYLSCSFETLMRDLELLKAGGWKVEWAKGYALFPGTNHVEILVDLRR